MRTREARYAIPELDMTPMIDMTFQLIAFFMFVMNFSTELVREEIQLPVVQLAQPVTQSKVEPIVLNVDSDGSVYLPGEVINVMTPDGLAQLNSFLYREAALARLRMRAAGLPPDSPLNSTVIIRGDRATPFDVIRKVLRSCREAGFVHYSLRAETRAQ